MIHMHFFLLTKIHRTTTSANLSSPMLDVLEVLEICRLIDKDEENKSQLTDLHNMKKRPGLQESPSFGDAPRSLSSRQHTSAENLRQIANPRNETAPATAPVTWSQSDRSPPHRRDILFDSSTMQATSSQAVHSVSTGQGLPPLVRDEYYFERRRDQSSDRQDTERKEAPRLPVGGAVLPPSTGQSVSANDSVIDDSKTTLEVGRKTDPNERTARNAAALSSLDERHLAIIKEQEYIERKIREEQCRQRKVEQQLQQQLLLEQQLERKKQVENADLEMQSSITGKAWNFVERIYQIHKSHSKSRSYGAEPVSADDMVFLAEHLFQTQQQFREQGLPSAVDLAFHYTSKENMSRIRTDGLLSKAERESMNIRSAFNGEVYGQGIYTGSDPLSFSSYGSVGLIIARLKGLEMDPVKSRRRYEKGNTSITKGPLVVLEKSSQCLAIMQFPRNNGDAVMRVYREDLQKAIDSFFNDQDCIQVSFTQSAAVCLSEETESGDVDARDSAKGSTRMNTGAQRPVQMSASAARASKEAVRVQAIDELLEYAAPDFLPTPTLFSSWEHSSRETKSCSICSQPLTKRDEESVKLKKCGHVYHRQCIEMALQKSVRCPHCLIVLTEAKGTMPSGTMYIRKHASMVCSGFPPGTIIIRYTIFAGVQRVYHDNPGLPYESAEHVAYLPDNDDGRRLLSRLKIAFMNGLTFTVGFSVETRKSNSVEWASIPHKTSVTGGGMRGFPDQSYFSECNVKLDDLGVPRI